MVLVAGRSGIKQAADKYHYQGGDTGYQGNNIVSLNQNAVVASHRVGIALAARLIADWAIGRFALASA